MLLDSGNNLSDRVNAYLQRAFLIQKLDNWIGYVLFFLIALGLGYLMAVNMVIGIGLLGLVVGLAVVLICMFDTEAGIYINMFFSFFAFGINRFFNDSLPVGIISDVLILATLFSFLIRRISFKKSINEFAKTSVVTVLLIVYAYLAIQLFNPNANSFNGWYQAFRKTLATLLILFIAFNHFDSPLKIKRFIRVLFILCFITGFYGCFQDWFGLFPYEKAWVMADGQRFGLIFIGGDFRKFSTMSDPTAYGLLMGAAGVFFIIYSLSIKNITKKRIIWLGVVFMFLGMSYSGTRTANAMVVAGFVLYFLLGLNKKSTQLFAIFAALLFAVIMYGPYSNSTINRFRTTFSPSEDASFNVREESRKRMQPYIHSQPIGGGLGTTGSFGATFHPGHYLAGFHPDSGYLKKALETGWVGLGIFCVLYFLILRSGIRGYFSCKDPTHQAIYAGCTCAIFCFYVADFSQVAMGQLSDIFVYYPFIAIILKLKTLNNPQNEPV